ncbi:MAG: DUF2807 domain-containing protein [Caulobacteraceae bacterium]
MLKPLRMLVAVGAAALGSLALSPGAAGAATILRIDQAAVRVTVIPENRTDLDVKLVTANRGLPLWIDTSGDEVRVRGNLDWGAHCGPDDNLIFLWGFAPVPVRDLPRLVVRAPRDARVIAGGIVFGDIGRTHSLALSATGCGTWTVGEVETSFNLRQTGSGTVRASNAASLLLSMTGSGDLFMGRVSGKMDLQLVGSGDVKAASAGSLDCRLTGSGDVRVDDIGGATEVLIAGSGDVWLGRVRGPMRAEITGSGDIRAASGEVTVLDARIKGSGDFSFRGTAESLNAEIYGPGDIYVARVTGRVSQTVRGPGDVHVGT